MKWKDRKKTIILLALSIITVACGIFFLKVEREKETILEFGMFAGSNWDVPNGNCYAIIDRAIERFEAENPGVKVKYHSGILKEDYTEWFSKQLLLGTEPDVFMVLEDDFNNLSSIEALKNMDEIIKKDKEYHIEEYYTPALEEGQYQGSQYALPYETVPVLMFVNKSLLEEEGVQVPDNDWTWDDFYRICRQVTKDKDGDGMLDQFGCYDYTWKNALYSNGGRLFDEDGRKVYFNSDKVSEAVRFIKKLEQLNENYIVTAKEFDNGHVAFRPFPFSSYRTYQSYPLKIKKYSSFEWDCITMPAGPQGENKSEIRTLQMGISARTSNEKLAWEFIKCLTYDERTQLDIFKYSQGVSVLKSVTESVEVDRELRKDVMGARKIIDNKLLSDIVENSVIMPRFSKYREVMEVADAKVEKMIKDNVNPESTLLSLQWEIKKMLNR